MNGHGGARPGAGKPKGSKANHTIQAEAYKKLLIELVLQEAAPIIAALIVRAKTGDVQAIKEINERVIGKVAQPLKNDDDSPLIIQWLQSPSNTSQGAGQKPSTKA